MLSYSPAASIRIQVKAFSAEASESSLRSELSANQILYSRGHNICINVPFMLEEVNSMGVLTPQKREKAVGASKLVLRLYIASSVFVIA